MKPLASLSGTTFWILLPFSPRETGLSYKSIEFAARTKAKNATKEQLMDIV